MDNLKTIKVNFVGSDVGDKVVSISYNPAEHDFVNTMNLASIVFYNIFDYTYEELKQTFNLFDLSEEVYEIAAEILDNGYADVSIGNFLDFLKQAFGWEHKFIKLQYTYDIIGGHFI